MSNQMNTSSNKKNSNILLWGVILLLVAAGAYFFISKNNAVEEKENTEARLEEVNYQKEELNKEYEAAIVRLDQLTTANNSKDSAIIKQESEIGSLRTEIENILNNQAATNAELKQAKGLIASLEALTTKYQKQIGALKQENIQLIDDKKQLTEEKQTVQNERDNLQEDKSQLEKTVDLAKVLSISNVDMKVINKKKNLLGKEKEKATTKARKADLLEVNFDLGVNRVIESGDKTIYISVIDPSGNVIHSKGNEAGNIELISGGQKDYTTKKTVAYKQGKNAYDIKTVCVPTDKFNSGNYKVELYHKGYLIGQDNITLR